MRADPRDRAERGLPPRVRPDRGPWPVIALCAAVAGLGAGPGFLYGFVGPALQADLELSRGSLGLLIGVFFGATGVASIGASRWGARLGARGCLVLNMGVMAAAMAMVASVATYPALLAGAVASGVGYAFGTVGTTMAVMLVARPGTVGFGLTVKTAGVPLVASGLALGTGASSESWAWLAWTLAASGIGVGLLTLWVLPRTPSAAAGRAAEGVLPRGFWLLPLAAFLFIGGSQPLQSWAVTYVHDAGGVSTAHAGPVVAVGTLIGTIAMVAVARWADRVGAARRALLVAGVSAVAAAGIIVTVAATPWWLPLGLTGAVLGIAANLSGSGLTHAVAAERSPGAIGRGSGMLLTGYYVGALAAPWVFGLLADHTGGYVVPWTLSAVLMLLACGAFLVIHRVLPVDQPALSPAAAERRRWWTDGGAGRRRD